MGNQSKVSGPLVSERRLTAGRYVQLGEALHPTTVRAEIIDLRLNSVLHGMAWASQTGRVLA